MRSYHVQIRRYRLSFHVTDEMAISLMENEHGNQQNKPYLRVVGLSKSAWVMLVRKPNEFGRV